jgi:opacity protein-like surface antigen
MTIGSRRSIRHGLSVSALALALITFNAGAAQAQQSNAAEPVPPGHWSVTPSIALGFGGEVDGAGFGFGVDAGYNWSSRVSFEGSFLILPSVGSNEFEGVVDVDSTVWNLAGNVLYHFSQRPFMPYVAAGLGVGHATADIDFAVPGFDLDESSSSLIVNFGAGVKRQLGARTNFRADLRYFTGGDVVPDFWRLGLGIGFDLGRR